MTEPIHRCERHPFELADGYCTTCGHAFCEPCLVFPFGPKKKPFCVSCAIAAAGVRRNAALPVARSSREIKELARQRRRAEKLERLEQQTVRKRNEAPAAEPKPKPAPGVIPAPQPRTGGPLPQRTSPAFWRGAST
jgi:hypothetical protein